MRIKVINPTTSGARDAETRKEYAGYAFRGTEISIVHLDRGPASIECELDEAICVPDFINKAKQAEAEGYEAIISNCFGDPAVRAAREVVNVPVVGACEASMHFAATLGQHFAVVTILPNIVSMVENLAMQYGLDKKLVSIRYVNIPVLQLEDRDMLISALHREMLAAVKEDHAHVLVLGCTGMIGVAKELEGLLRRDGYEVPVVDPVGASVKFAEALITMGLKQSRLTFMPPPEKARPGFP